MLLDAASCPHYIVQDAMRMAGKEVDCLQKIKLCYGVRRATRKCSRDSRFFGRDRRFQERFLPRISEMSGEEEHTLLSQGRDRRVDKRVVP